jgi:hypothetical protein
MSFTPLSRANWLATSNDASNGAASNAIDGNLSTIWGTNQTLPCWITLDMAPTILPRTGWAVLGTDSTAGGYPGSNVLDGNPSSIWSSSGGGSGYISLDMGASGAAYDTLLIQNRADAGGLGSLNSFSVFVSADGVTWGTAIATFTGNSTPSQINTFALGGSYTQRYLKIQVASVFGASNIVIAEIWTANNSAPPAPPTFNAITYQGRQDGPQDFPGSIQVFVSADGVTWGTAVFSQSGLPNTPLLQGFGFSSQTARYLRLQINSPAVGARNYQGAAEINVGTGLPGNAVLSTSDEQTVFTGTPSARLTSFDEQAIVTGLNPPEARLTYLAQESVFVPGVWVTTDVVLTQFSMEMVFSTALPPGSPEQRGQIDYDQVQIACRRGSGSQFQMAGSGAFTPGDVLVYDANGNAVDGGPPSAGAGFPNGVVLPLRISAGSTTAALADYAIIVTATGTVTLPASPPNGQSYQIKNGISGTGSVTVSGGTIDGISSLTLAALASVSLIYDGTMWRQI